MNLSKSREFFAPENVSKRVHIIGCGAVGSTIAENLARCGVTKVTLWDFDKVKAHNIANQMFFNEDIGRLKVDAVQDMMLRINPECEVKKEPNGWKGKRLSGYVFLAVDSIELRREIVESIKDSGYVKAVFDVRMRLTDAQGYAADWSVPNQIENLLTSMDFSHEEALEETPVSACNVTLSVSPTVRIICAYQVANFINFVKGQGLKKMILIDAFNFEVDAF